MAAEAALVAWGLRLSTPEAGAALIPDGAPELTCHRQEFTCGS